MVGAEKDGLKTNFTGYIEYTVIQRFAVIYSQVLCRITFVHTLLWADMQGPLMVLSTGNCPNSRIFL